LHQKDQSPFLQQIENDLPRTFPTHAVYSRADGLAPLKRVLVAYSWYNTSVGYCQGMNFVAALFLLLMDEESAFWLLSAIVDDIVPDYYAPVMIGCKADTIVFEHLVEKKLPGVYAHWKQMDNLPFQQVVQ